MLRRRNPSSTGAAIGAATHAHVSVHLISADGCWQWSPPGRRTVSNFPRGADVASLHRVVCRAARLRPADWLLSANGLSPLSVDASERIRFGGGDVHLLSAIATIQVRPLPFFYSKVIRQVVASCGQSATPDAEEPDGDLRQAVPLSIRRHESLSAVVSRALMAAHPEMCCQPPLPGSGVAPPPPSGIGLLLNGIRVDSVESLYRSSSIAVLSVQLPLPLVISVRASPDHAPLRVKVEVSGLYAGDQAVVTAQPDEVVDALRRLLAIPPVPDGLPISLRDASGRLLSGAADAAWRVTSEAVKVHASFDSIHLPARLRTGPAGPEAGRKPPKEDGPEEEDRHRELIIEDSDDSGDEGRDGEYVGSKRGERATISSTGFDQVHDGFECQSYFLAGGEEGWC